MGLRDPERFGRDRPEDGGHLEGGHSRQPAGAVRGSIDAAQRLEAGAHTADVQSPRTGTRRRDVSIVAPATWGVITTFGTPRST